MGGIFLNIPKLESVETFKIIYNAFEDLKSAYCVV